MLQQLLQSIHFCGNPWHDLPLYLGLGLIAGLAWISASVARLKQFAHNLFAMLVTPINKSWSRFVGRAYHCAPKERHED